MAGIDTGGAGVAAGDSDDTSVDTGVVVAGTEVANRSSNVVTERFLSLSPCTSRGSTCAITSSLAVIV